MPIAAAYLIVIVIWSTTPIAIKWSAEGSGYLFGVSARMLLATVICVLLLRLKRQTLALDRKAILSYLAASLGIYGAMLAVYWGSQYIHSGLISVLFGLSPIITSVLAAVVLRENSVTVPKILGSLLGVFGLYVIFTADTSSTHASSLGTIAILVAACLHATSAVLLKHINAQVPAMVMNTGGLLVASALFSVTWIVSGASIPEHISIQSAAAIVYLGVFATVFGFSLYFYMLKVLDAASIGLIPLITPVTALLLGESLNGEIIRASVWWGTGLIGMGLLLHQWSQYKPYLIKSSNTDS